MKNKNKKRKVILAVFIVAVLSLIVSAVVVNYEKIETAYVFSQVEEEMTMKYDDYFSDYGSVKIIDKGTPDSFAVGYGVSAGTPDKAVVTIENGRLHAVGTGVAVVDIDGKVYSVTVEPAEISMFLMLGQSNMYGSEGSGERSVVNEDGTVYSTCGLYDLFTKENAMQFVPSSLSGDGSKVSIVGTNQMLNKSPVNCLTDSGEGRKGLDAAFAKKWHELTGDKVWMINAAHSGKAIRKWLKGTSEYEEAVTLFKNAQWVMKKEIAAGHYILKDYGYFWLHGCSDREHTAKGYVEDFLSMHNDLKKDLLYDIDGDGQSDKLRFCNVLMPRSGKDDCNAYRTGTRTDTTERNYYQSFYDLEMRGHRVALYWLVNNPELKDINLVCNIGDQWVYMPDGSNGVKEYFNSKYKDGRVDYTVQVPQKEDWYTPDTPADIHDNVHYNQIGYNELGFEAAQNSAYTLGRVAKPENVETTVTFYNWTGYQKVSKVNATAYKDSSSLIVPVVYPVYESKNVSYSVTEGLKYEYYDLTAALGNEGGILRSTGADNNAVVHVKGKAETQQGKNAYYWIGTDEGISVKNEENYSVNELEAHGSKSNVEEKGVLNGAYYSFEDSIELSCDHEWMIEWTGRVNENTKEDIFFDMFSGNVRDDEGRIRGNVSVSQMYDAEKEKLEIVFTVQGMKTESIDLSELVKDPSRLHTYRIYSRIEEDGLNKIIVNVDDKCAGETEELSGVNFSLSDIGSRKNKISNYKINYIKIFEECYCDVFGHTFSVAQTKKKDIAKGKYKYKCVCGYLYTSDK